jgi:cobalt-zinc-cadmium efflux system membrane fusion protein
MRHFIRKLKRPRALLVALLAMGLMALCGCNASKPETHAPAANVGGDRITFSTNAPQLAYLAIEPAQKRKTAAIGLYGRLAWNDDVTVRVFSPAAGRVATVPLEVNQPVQRGDVLATLESPDYGQAQSDAQKSASDLALADRTLTRVRELFEHGAAARKDLDSAEADFAKAQSENARATAQLRSISLGYTNNTPGKFDLRSPLEGVLVEKNITPGQQIRSDQMLANAPQFVNPLFVVTDPTRLWLFLDVTELEINSLAPSQELVIHARAMPERTFRGRIEVIGRGLDPSTRTIKVRCLVDNSDKLLRAEMYVNVDVESETSTGVDVTTKAVFLRNNQPYIFVETGPGQFQRRAVRLGFETNGHSTILDGLTSGEKVVTDGCLLLEAMLEGDNS